MKSWYRPRASVDANDIMEFFSTHQHLHPHQTLADAMSQASKHCGFCPGAAEQAMERLAVNRQQAFGRLKRSELQQLARSVYRIWQSQNLAPSHL